MIFVSSATRSSRLVTENVWNARLAAATALSTSALEPSAISYIASSVAGLTTGVDFLRAGSPQAPLRKNFMGLTIVTLLISGAKGGRKAPGKHLCTKGRKNEPAI